MSNTYQNRWGFHRSDNGVILGVCAGLAERLGLSTRGVRLVAVIGLILTGLWPLIGLYFLAALLMKPAPGKSRSRSTSASGCCNRTSRRSSRTFETMDGRLRNLEDVITSREYDWDRRFSQS